LPLYDHISYNLKISPWILSTTMFAPRNILSIIELSFFTPALVLSLILSKRHGFRSDLGWAGINLLALFRLAGASTEIASSYYPTNSPLLTVSIILQNFGLASLLVAITGILKRINNTTDPRAALPARSFNLILIPTSLAILLSIIGATQSITPTTISPTLGHLLQKIAALLFVAVFATLVLIIIWTFVNRSCLLPSKKPLLTASVLSVPFMAVRMAYAVLVVWGVKGEVFTGVEGTTTAAVVVRACMAALEEFVVVAALLTAGFLARPVLDGMAGWEFPRGKDEGSQVGLVGVAV